MEQKPSNEINQETLITLINAHTEATNRSAEALGRVADSNRTFAESIAGRLDNLHRKMDKIIKENKENETKNKWWVHALVIPLVTGLMGVTGYFFQKYTDHLFKDEDKTKVEKVEGGQ